MDLAHRSKLLTLILMLFGSLFQVCCGNDLSRQTAAKLINENYGYPKPIGKFIQVGSHHLRFTAHKPDIFQVSEAEDLKKYQDAGLVLINDVKLVEEDLQCNCGYGTTYRASFVLQITPEGQRYLMPQEKSTARLCSEELAEVTGIAFSGDKSQAQVEFNSRCSDVTPFGKVDEVDETELTAHWAMMRLYDDGWRIVR